MFLFYDLSSVYVFSLLDGARLEPGPICAQVGGKKQTRCSGCVLTDIGNPIWVWVDIYITEIMLLMFDINLHRHL